MPSTSFSVQIETANALTHMMKREKLHSRTDGIKFLLEIYNNRS
jgi:hypothetical protein